MKLRDILTHLDEWPPFALDVHLNADHGKRLTDVMAMNDKDLHELHARLHGLDLDMEIDS